MPGLSDVRLEISSSSRVMNWTSPYPEPEYPVVKMNDKPLPLPTPARSASPSGLLALVIKANSDFTDESNIVLNEYLPFGTHGQHIAAWWETYYVVYDQLLRDLLSASNIDNQLLILAGYGLDNDMSPTSDLYEYMLRMGAGSQLQTWEKEWTGGSRGPTPYNMVAFPATYILVGFSNLSYGHGWEKHERGADKVETTLRVTLQNHD